MVKKEDLTKLVDGAKQTAGVVKKVINKDTLRTTVDVTVKGVEIAAKGARLASKGTETLASTMEKASSGIKKLGAKLKKR